MSGGGGLIKEEEELIFTLMHFSSSHPYKMNIEMFPIQLIIKLLSKF
jgi:hypothetical protein